MGFTTKNPRNQRKNIGLSMESIGTDEKAEVLFRKTWEQTKKHWFDYAKHSNQQKNKGCNVKSIGTNEKALVLLRKA